MCRHAGCCRAARAIANSGVGRGGSFRPAPTSNPNYTFSPKTRTILCVKQQLLFFLVILCAYALAAANAVIYPGVVANKLFGFDTRTLVILIPAFIVLYKTRFALPSPKVLQLHNRYFVPITLITSALLTFVQYRSEANYVYGLLHIDFAAAWYFSVLTLSVFLATQTLQWYVHNWKWIVFFTPPIFLLTLLVVLVKAPFVYKQIIIEDSIIEWLQLLSYAVSCIMSGILAKQLWKENRVLAVIFGTASLAFFVFCGEEISWGQRIFNIETPEDLAAINNQDETNLHNIDWFYHYVYRGYILVGIYGTLSAAFGRYILKMGTTFIRKYSPLFLPQWQYLTWFGIAGYYFLQRFYFIPGDLQGRNTWEENMELLLIGSIAVFLTEQYLRTKKSEATQRGR